jgi:hypothetical protein
MRILQRLPDSSACWTKARRLGAGLRSVRLATIPIVLIGVIVASASSAQAATPAPGWAVSALAMPTSFSTSDTARCTSTLGKAEPLCDSYVINIANAGELATSATPVVIEDELPPGLRVERITFHWSSFPAEFGGELADLDGFGLCTATPVAAASTVRCELPPTLFGLSLPRIAPDDVLVMRIATMVETPSGPGVLHNKVTVSGGGAPAVTTTMENSLEAGPQAFGPSGFGAEIRDTNGADDTQAGSHPYEFATTFALNNGFRVAPDSGGAEGDTTTQDLKDAVVDLPVGFVGSGKATPTCTFAQLSSHVEHGVGGCPTDSIVGHIRTAPSEERADTINGPIYNMVPEEGFAAEFAYVDTLAGAHVLYANVVPSAHGYVLRTIAREIPQVTLTHVEVVFYGNPAERDGAGTTPLAFFTNPSSCSGEPLETELHVDSWQHPGRLTADGEPDLTDPHWVGVGSASAPVTGCNELRFEPESFNFQPETTVADSPTGATFDLRVPQPETPTSLASPPLRSAKVTLPSGLVVNPAAASGLEACSTSEIGWSGPGVNDFTAQAPACPDASKVGSVEITSPLIPSTLLGSVYLASANSNPLHSYLAAYIVVNDRPTGVLVKIAGKLELDPNSGQITGVFEENPQLPFSELKLKFFGGSRGELATPEACGTYSTLASLMPWSAPDSGLESTLSDSFPINSGCATGFNPGFAAGVTSTQAGGYSPIEVSFSREDSEQEIAGISVFLPPGLLAKLKGVSLCSDASVAAAATKTASAELASPSCPSTSKVGTVQAGAGAGPAPFFLPGQAYLTGPYKGAPYGLAVIVPALAGPFDLGTVVVRQALEVDPTDAHVTDVSDPLPAILDAKGEDGQADGFPIRLRQVDISIDRPEFGLNPTNCGEQHITAAISAAGGAAAGLSSRFRVGGCASLKFAPKFTASTAGKASKANGASLDVKVGYPTGPLGTYANIKAVKVVLPKQLPSRLTTLQKACLAATFEANPARCPAASNVGSAIAITPILNSPLTGPAYLVSHGGEAFPDLEIVLQGENIKLILVGNTQIKNGITSSTFKVIPDAPVSSFELKLPTGKFSILGANVPQSAKYSLCGQTLTMPTEITAQNGAQLNQTTKITITGCAKPKTLTRPEKLKKALKACHKDKSKAKRAKCEKAAHKRYGPVKSKQKAKRKA